MPWMPAIVKTIGLLCNCTMDADPIEQLSPSLVNRAFLIGEQLRPMGIDLFLYSPKDVTGEGEVPGYRVEGHEMIRDRRCVPDVNANWTYGTRKLINQGMHNLFAAGVRFQIFLGGIRRLRPAVDQNVIPGLVAGRLRAVVFIPGLIRLAVFIHFRNHPPVAVPAVFD